MNWDDINWEKSYDPMPAYSQSKLSNILHAKELARRLEGTGITVYVLNPGTIDTELGRHFYETNWWAKPLTYITPYILKTPLNGAQTTLYCILEPSIENHSGRYYSDCEEIEPHRRALIESDQRKLWELSEKFVGLK